MAPAARERQRSQAEINRLRGEPWYRALVRQEKCAYCGAWTPRELRTRDHVIALSRGGRTSPENLLMACKVCNQTKSTKGLLGMLELRASPERSAEVIATICNHAGIDEEHLRFLTR